MSLFWYAAYSSVFVEMAKETFEKMGKDVHVEVWNPSRLEAVTEMGVRIILARGATALRIRAVTDIPVVEIPVIFEDLMSAILAASTFGSNIAIIGYHNLMQGIELLNPILNVNIRQITALDAEDTYQHLIRLREEHIDAVIGGIYQTDLARQLCMPAVRINLSARALSHAIKEAEQLLNSLLYSQRKQEELNMILNTTKEGYITVDQDGKILLINQTALRYFTTRQLDLAGLRLHEVCPAFSKILGVLSGKEEITSEPINLFGQNVLYDIVPLKYGHSEIIGAMVTLHDTGSITRGESKLRTLKVQEYTAKYHFHNIIGNSPAIGETIRLAKKYAESDLTVLITGETGAGKEMFAQSIHNAGSRKKSPFISISCGSLPGNLLERELFGYEKGAVPGSHGGSKMGLLEMAHNGTLFLDEVGELPLHLQNRLLRVMKEKRVIKIGGFQATPVNVRILAASSQNLISLVEQGKFRAELFYCLNVLTLKCPPLRERKEDIPLLIRTFFKEEPSLRHSHIRLTEDALSLLTSYKWPGNAPQLMHFLQRLSIISDSKNVDDVMIAGLLARFEPQGKEFLSGSVTQKVSDRPYPKPAVSEPVCRKNGHPEQDLMCGDYKIHIPKESCTEPADCSHKRKHITKSQLLLALSLSSSNIAEVSERLGIHRTTVWRLCKKYGIEFK